MGQANTLVWAQLPTAPGVLVYSGYVGGHTLGTPGPVVATVTGSYNPYSGSYSYTATVYGNTGPVYPTVRQAQQWAQQQLA